MDVGRLYIYLQGRSKLANIERRNDGGKRNFNSIKSRVWSTAGSRKDKYEMTGMTEKSVRLKQVYRYFQSSDFLVKQLWGLGETVRP